MTTLCRAPFQDCPFIPRTGDDAVRHGAFAGMVEAAVVAGVADHPFLCRPECRRTAAVEVEGVREPQQAGDVSRFGDCSTGGLTFGAAVDHGHHHFAVRALADQRTRVSVGIEAVAGVVFDDLASADQ